MFKNQTGINVMIFKMYFRRKKWRFQLETLLCKLRKNRNVALVFKRNVIFPPKISDLNIDPRLGGENI
jgi:hypothetical protein